MPQNSKTQIVFSTDFNEIGSPQFKDWGVHLICINGSGRFLFKEKEILINKNDAMVLPRPDLVTDITQSEDLQIVFVAASFKLLYNQLPANNYGVGGCVSLFENPIFHLTDEDARALLDDLYRFKQRMNDTDHLFYNEMIGSLLLTMIYDLFAFHAKHQSVNRSTERNTNIVKGLVAILSTGSVKYHRDVSYYAEQLHVTPKYLSDTIKRNIGRSVLNLIDQYTKPMVIEFLKNTDLSISQIADSMNFSSLSYFTRYVVKHFGMTPSQYRKTQLPAKKI